MSIHENLIQTDDAQLTIETTADVIKPVFAYADTLVDEVNLHVTPDGMEYEQVDPANVCMVGMDVPAEAFENYDADETTIGLDVSRATGALRAGRKREGDDVTFSYGDMRLSSTVHRDYDGTVMDLQTSFNTLDPDMIRQGGDVPEIDLPVTATVPRDLFNDACEAVNATTDHIRFRSDGDDLLISGESDASDTTAVVSGVVDGEGADSIFSLDYFKDLRKALATVGVDEVTLSLGEEFPIRVEWTAEWNDADVSGYWFQAPRIQSD